MYIYYFEIASLVLKVVSRFEISWIDQMKQFLTSEKEKYDMIYHIEEMVHEIDVTKLECLAADPLLYVYQYKDSELRVHYLTGEKRTMQCLYKKDHISIEIESHCKQYSYFYMVGMMFDKILNLHQKYILHCCYINYHNKAILFSGDSGAGKSTQGELWKKYEKTTIVNGDRCVLGLEKEVLTAYGFPVCGSSDYCLDEILPVAAIVFIKQSPTNAVRVMKQKEALIHLMKQISINNWDKNIASQGIDFLVDVTCRIPIYELSCDISQKAVDVLKELIDR